MSKQLWKLIPSIVPVLLLVACSTLPSRAATATGGIETVEPTSEPAPQATAETSSEPTEFTPPTLAAPATLTSTEMQAVRGRAGDRTNLWTMTMLTEELGWGLVAGRVLRTEDGGRSWLDVTPPDPQLIHAPGFPRAYGAFLDPETAWVAIVDPFNLPVQVWAWKSQDGGANWTRAAPISLIPGTEVHVLLEAVDADHAWLLADVIVNKPANMHSGWLYITRDGGDSWSEVVLPVSRSVDIQFVDPELGFAAEPPRQGAAEDPRVWETRNGGLTWEATLMPEPIDQPGLFSELGFCRRADLSATPDGWVSLLFDCGQRDQLLFRSPAHAASWRYVELPPPSDGTNQVMWFDERNGYQLGHDMYRTVDGGLSWMRFKSVTWLGEFSFAGPQYGWAFAQTGPEVAFVFTQDFGETWEIFEPRLVSSFPPP